MKTCFLLFLAAALFQVGCLSDADSDIEQIDSGLISELVTAMELSIAYNDSLEVAIADGNESMADHFNEMYHFYDSLYDTYHEEFSHRSSREDHHHDEHGMHHSAGMMNDHSDTEGHHMSHHQTMDSLLISHETFHPHH